MKSLYFCFLDVEDQEEGLDKSSSEMSKKKYEKPDRFKSELFSTIFNYFQLFSTIFNCLMQIWKNQVFLNNFI